MITQYGLKSNATLGWQKYLILAVIILNMLIYHQTVMYTNDKSLNTTYVEI